MSGDEPKAPLAHARKTGPPSEAFSAVVEKVRARTPARLLVGRAGAAYRTETQLALREAHAAARDAVRAELEMSSAFGAAFVERFQLFEVRTRARSKDEYLLRPDLGRQFDSALARRNQKPLPDRDGSADRDRRRTLGPRRHRAGSRAASAAV